MKRLELAEKLVDRARTLGADEAEAYVLESAAVRIEIHNGAAKTVNYTDTAGFGIRVLKDGKLGFASSNCLAVSEADDVIRKLLQNTQWHSPDEHNILPDPVASEASDEPLERLDETLKAVPIGDKIEKAIAIETAAKGADPRIQQIPFLAYGDAVKKYAIGSSRGISAASGRSEVYGVVMAVAVAPAADSGGSADMQTGIGIDVVTRFTDLNPEVPGRKAAEYALRMLGAVDGNTEELDGIFPPETGNSFVKLVADMVSADRIQKKKSLFSGRLGEMVASPLVTMIDDGRLKGGLASAAVDAEGIPTTTKAIIKDGRLEQILYDSYTAHKDNTRSTGNGDRHSYDSRPVIAPTNFYMHPGTESRDKIIGSVRRGLFVTEVSGLHASVDQVTGNFSIPAKGILIRDGELSTPIVNVAISGNVFGFLKGISAVADDLTWEPRDYVIGVPTFKVAGIKIGGR